MYPPAHPRFLTGVLEPRQDGGEPLPVGAQVNQHMLQRQVPADAMRVAGGLLVGADQVIQALEALGEQVDDLCARQGVQEHQPDITWKVHTLAPGQILPQQGLKEQFARYGEAVDLARRALALLLSVDLHVARLAQPLQDGIGRWLLHLRQMAQVALNKLVQLIAVLTLYREQPQEQQFLLIHRTLLLSSLYTHFWLINLDYLPWSRYNLNMISHI